MKLKKWIKSIDPIVDVVIWTQDDNEEPAYSGCLLDVPWTFMNMRIGRVDGDMEEPIYISMQTNKQRGLYPIIVINLIAD